MPDTPGHPDLYIALAAATLEIAGVTKSETADTGAYKYKYTTLTDTLRAIKPALARHGLSLMQPIHTRDGQIHVDTLVIHDSGDYLHFPGPGMPLVRSPQDVGGIISYLRRYALTSMFALEVLDDDAAAANAASKDAPMSPEEMQRFTTRCEQAGLDVDEVMADAGVTDPAYLSDRAKLRTSFNELKANVKVEPNPMESEANRGLDGDG